MSHDRSHDRLYRTEAVVLRRSDLGEADRLLTLYTPEHGKLRALAKGVRKITSRKAGHVELFMRAQLLLARGRDLDIITQAEMVEAYRPLREDLLRTSYAAYVVELLDRFAEEGSDNPPLYYLLVRTLQWLSEAGDPALVARFFELNLLSLVGYSPQLFQCVDCGRSLAAVDQFFGPVEGGVLCPDCAPRHPGVLPLSLTGLKVLRYFQVNDFETARQVHIHPGVHAELEAILLRYITYLLERNVKSIGFLRLVRRGIFENGTNSNVP